MSLINYVEPISIGAIIVSFGTLIVALVIAWFFYRILKPIAGWVEGVYNHDLKYWIVEEKMLDKVAQEKGIDLDAELLKRNVLQEKPRQSFRRKMEDEVFNKMFPEEKVEKSKK